MPSDGNSSHGLRPGELKRGHPGNTWRRSAEDEMVIAVYYWAHNGSACQKPSEMEEECQWPILCQSKQDLSQVSQYQSVIA